MAESGKERIRVAVLMGGVSLEHEVSLDSGTGVIANLMPDRYAGRKVVIRKDGLWVVDDAPPAGMLEALALLKREADVVFLALHGPNGEDGTMQGLLHLLDIPYTGSDHYASSLAMNKPRAKDAYRAAGIPTPEDVLVRAGDVDAGAEALAAGIVGRLGLPVVAKTTRLGSSVGVAVVREERELAEKLAELVRYGPEVLVERFVRGRELTAPVIDDPYAGETVALPLIEIRPRVAGWFDYRAKYELGGSEEICPAPIPEELAQECRRLGLLAHRVLGCTGMSRTDLIADEAGTCFVLETNTIPGFTRTSLLPQAAKAAGISYAELVDMLIQDALVRRQGRSVLLHA